jgi:hypothetical protein
MVGYNLPSVWHKSKLQILNSPLRIEGEFMIINPFWNRTQSFSSGPVFLRFRPQEENFAGKIMWK